MGTYRVWLSNGSAVLVDAWSAQHAKEIAEDDAAKAGYGGLSAERVEQVSKDCQRA